MAANGAFKIIYVSIESTEEIAPFPTIAGVDTTFYPFNQATTQSSD